jgi:DNA-binding NarL/FixJ family response regulator
MAPLRVVLVDDHVLLRQALATLLRARPGIEVAGEFADGREALTGIPALRPDVVLMDVALPLLDGIEATRRLRREAPEVRVIMLSADVDSSQLRDALRAGAHGYVVKRADMEELLLAIRAVASGNTFFSSEITRNYDLDDIRRQALAPGQVSGLGVLTSREREILQLIVEGRTVPEIARLLVISPKTVEGHKTRIMARLGVRNRTELIRFALLHRPGAGPQPAG